MLSTSHFPPTPLPRQGAVPKKIISPIRRGMTIELDEKGDQILVDGQKYSRVMPGTLDSQVWAWAGAGNLSRQSTPGIVIISDDDEDDDEILIIEDDEEVEYEGEIPRLSTRPPSLHPRMFTTPYRTPVPPTPRHPTARELGKRRQMDHGREMSLVSAAGDDWPLASLYQIPSNRVKRVVREARNQGLHARVIPRSRVVPVPKENNLPWIKEEEYEEEDSGFFEGFVEGGGRSGKERERDRDWEVILGTDEGAVEHLQRIVLSNQEEERQRESRRAMNHHRHHHPHLATSNSSPPMGVPMIAPPSPQPGANWMSIFMAMIVGAMAMLYLLLKMPDD